MSSTRGPRAGPASTSWATTSTSSCGDRAAAHATLNCGPSAVSRACSATRRLFPAPPGPTTVTSRPATAGGRHGCELGSPTHDRPDRAAGVETATRR